MRPSQYSKSANRKRQFKLRHIFGVLLGACVVLALFGSKLKHRIANNSARHSVENEYDHIAIRDAGRELLELAGKIEFEGVLAIDPKHFPKPISITNPWQVTVYDEILMLEYGPTGDVRLIVVPSGNSLPYGEPLAEGIAYDEIR